MLNKDAAELKKKTAMEDSKENKAYSLSEISEEEYEKLGFISIFLTLKNLNCMYLKGIP